LSHTSISISLPDEIVALVDDILEREHRSRSDVVQEALRQYLGITEPAIPEGQKELLASELEAFRQDPTQPGLRPEELIGRLRDSRRG